MKSQLTHEQQAVLERMRAERQRKHGLVVRPISRARFGPRRPPRTPRKTLDDVESFRPTGPRYRMPRIDLAICLVEAGEKTCRTAALVYKLSAQHVLREWNCRHPDRIRSFT